MCLLSQFCGSLAPKRKAQKYLQVPIVQWNVDPEDASMIDEKGTSNTQPGLFGVPSDDTILQGSNDDDTAEPSEAQAYLKI
jgi:hypothetical protein